MTKPSISVSAIAFKGTFSIRPIESTSRKFKTVSPTEYTLLRKYDYKRVHNRFEEQHEVFTIPKGFEFDGASSPRLLWPLFPPFTNNEIPAVILHDYLYANRINSRLFADKAFLAFLLFNGVSRTRARLMYLAVRLFGNKKWIT